MNEKPKIKAPCEVMDMSRAEELAKQMSKNDHENAYYIITGTYEGKRRIYIDTSCFCKVANNEVVQMWYDKGNKHLP